MSVPVSSINCVVILLYIDPRLMARIIISCFSFVLIAALYVVGTEAVQPMGADLPIVCTAQIASMVEEDGEERWCMCATTSRV
jgi:hypothetical protein